MLVTMNLLLHTSYNERLCLQLDDEPHMADALVTKGVAFGNAVPQQLKVSIYSFYQIEHVV